MASGMAGGQDKVTLSVATLALRSFTTSGEELLKLA
jgi:hypothetical protein